jgi:hypothetical protein
MNQRDSYGPREKIMRRRVTLGRQSETLEVAGSKATIKWISETR